MIRKPLAWNVKQISTMIEKGTITFDHPLQRPSGQWNLESMSLLIDSILRLFVPDIYAIQVKKEIDGKMVNVYDIIDGKQRLNIINDYKNDVWALTELDPVTLESTGETYNLSGKKFSELPEEVQQEILGYTLTIRVIEIEDDEDEEEIVEMIFYRLNNGKPMSAGHLAFVSAHKDVRKFIHEKVKNHPLFATVAHYPPGAIKKSDRELTVLQSILLASGIEYKSFANKDIENALRDKEIDVEVLDKVTAAFDMLAEAFPQYNKFVNKTNIPPMVSLIINNNFDKSVIPFLQNYAQTNKKGDLYRRYCGAGGTKKNMVEGRINGLQALYEQFH